jgi:TrmH family RNA methyltransferase
MISKNKYKYYSALLRKKIRDKERKFIAEGFKTVIEGLESGYSCETVFVTDEFESLNNKFPSKYDIEIETVSQYEFNKIADTVSPQGVAAVFNYPAQTDPEEISDDLIVCLENISDPGNLGTIIRNCDWFGIKEVLLSINCTDIYNPKTIRASMGSIFHVNIYSEIELPAFLSTYKKKKYDLLCADKEGENLYTFPKKKKNIIILSSESHGPSTEVISLSDYRITIPGYGKAESLNVASASAVILSRLTEKL